MNGDTALLVLIVLLAAAFLLADALSRARQLEDAAEELARRTRKPWRVGRNGK